jgi:RimJ/RimL family protein N-acetyltransferase
LGRNREFLAPWEPVREPEFFTREGQRAAIKCVLHELQHRVTVPHFQSCNIGYWVSADANGQGHATAAVAQMSEIAFREISRCTESRRAPFPTTPDHNACSNTTASSASASRARI